MASTLVCIAWALWFGGLGTLFLFVTHLFAVDRPAALKAAPAMFLIFEKYQLLLAAVALLAAAAWRLTANSCSVTVLFWLLGMAAVLAAAGPVLFTGRMEQLRLQGRSSSPEFKTLHGRSMILYSTQTLVLLAAGIALPWAMAPGAGEKET